MKNNFNLLNLPVVVKTARTVSSTLTFSYCANMKYRKTYFSDVWQSGEQSARRLDLDPEVVRLLGRVQLRGRGLGRGGHAGRAPATGRCGGKM